MSDIAVLVNEPSRKMHGKVFITYFNPLFETEIDIQYSSVAYNSNLSQIANGMPGDPNPNLFTLYDNILDGTSQLHSASTEVGWSAGVLTDAQGRYATPEFIEVLFAPKLLQGIELIGDVGKDNFLVDFDVVVTTEQGLVDTLQVRDNTKMVYTFVDDIPDIVNLKILIYRISRPYFPASVSELTVSSTILYKDTSLMNFSMTEELYFNDSIGVLGDIVANEIVVTLDNSTKEFYFNNSKSLVARQLKKNRRIEPFIGIEDTDGTITWTKLGVFWSYKWTVPVGSLTASVVGFDILGILTNLTFFRHYVYRNYSVGALLELILSDAKISLTLLMYDIDPSLYTITIPFAWFSHGSYMAALKKIAESGLVDIYCDREGAVLCRARRYSLSNFKATLTDDTNVKKTTYPTLNTDPFNLVQVKVATTVSAVQQELLNISTPFMVTAGTSTFLFQYTYDSNFSISIDTTVPYSYDVYSWGVLITFSGSGTVNSMLLTGSTISTIYSYIVSAEDSASIFLEGENSITIESPFIQDAAYASDLAANLLQAAYNERFIAEQRYRGNPWLTINDAVIFKDGIAPVDSYLITKHKLYFDGALTGEFRLRTGVKEE